VLVEEHSVPLSIVVTGANTHDVTQVESVLRSVVRDSPENKPQHLCADKAYDSANARQIMHEYGYVPHVRSRGEESQAKRQRGRKARRWIVECAHSWFNRFRKILVRYEKTQSSYMALRHLAAAIICWRKIGGIYG
jgi:putative transposase